MERTAKFLELSGRAVEFAQVTLAFDPEPASAQVAIEVAVEATAARQAARDLLDASSMQKP